MNNVVEFCQQRAAQCAADRGRGFRYGLTTIQALQCETIRYMERHGVPADVAARHCVRAPHESATTPREAA